MLDRLFLKVSIFVDMIIPVGLLCWSIVFQIFMDLVSVLIEISDLYTLERTFEYMESIMIYTLWKELLNIWNRPLLFIILQICEIDTPYKSITTYKNISYCPNAHHLSIVLVFLTFQVFKRYILRKQNFDVSYTLFISKFMLYTCIRNVHACNKTCQWYNG
jgi:hypothetical protein